MLLALDRGGEPYVPTTLTTSPRTGITCRKEMGPATTDFALRAAHLRAEMPVSAVPAASDFESC